MNQPQRTSGSEAYRLATVAGIALGMLFVEKKGNILELGKGALVGAFTVNGYAVIVRETADPVIVNQFMGLLLKHGAAAVIAGFMGKAVWEYAFQNTANSSLYDTDDYHLRYSG